MNEELFWNEMRACAVFPVVVTEDPEEAVELARALLAGDINFMEITFRTAAAEEAIRRVAAEVPDMCVGAGTCLHPGLAETAANAGARFIVTPGYSREVVVWCRERGMPVLPGTATPTDVMNAVNDGCRVVKLFPAALLGGTAYIDALASVFPGLRFVPSGGVDGGNAAAYAADRHVLACTGSWLAPRTLLREKRFGEIGALAAESARIVREKRG